MKGCAICVVHIPFWWLLSTESLYYVPCLVDCYHLAEIFLSFTHLIWNKYKTSLTNLNKDIFLEIPNFPMQLTFLFRTKFCYDSISDVSVNYQKHISVLIKLQVLSNDEKVFINSAEPIIDGQNLISHFGPSISDIMTLFHWSWWNLCSTCTLYFVEH